MLFVTYMKKIRNGATVAFFIGFLLLGGLTALFFSNITAQSVDIPYSIEADYFDIYQFNPVKNSPSRIIDQPITIAYPQSRFEFPHSEIELTKGKYSINGISQSSKTDFEKNINASDDTYGYIIPTISDSDNSILENYYNFQSNEGELFLLPLSPDLDHYLSFDDIDGTSGTIVDDSDIDEIVGRFNIANNPYLYPDNSTFIEVESDQTSESLSIDVSNGGLAIWNQSLQEMYSVMDNNRQEIIEGKYNPESFLGYFVNPTAEEVYEYAILSSIMDARNRNFFLWFAEKCFTYEDFLIGMGIDISDGYEVFASFNPYAVTNIRGKIALYIDAPDSEPDYPEMQNYSIQCYNYILNDWVTILTRHADPLLQLTNTWLFDEFMINTNHWQYIYDFEDDANEADSFVRWRVLVNGERDGNDDQPIKLRLGGLWTAIDQQFTEFEMEVSFKVTEEGIGKQNIKSARFILEYHTDDWEELYDGMYLVRDAGYYTYQQNFYSVDSGMWLTYEYDIHYQSIVNNAEIYAHPIRDNRVGISISGDLIDEDTTVSLTIHGKFNRFDRQGAVKDIKIAIDKMGMQYEYGDTIEIERKTWINYNSMDIFYWSYDMNISSNVVFLEFEYPNDWVFIDRYFAMVEKMDTGQNVSDIWIQSVEDDNYESLYDDSTVRFDSRSLFYLGPGTYRFWFRSFNYITDVSVYNSTYSKYELGGSLQVDDKTYYNVTLNNLWKDPTEKEDYEGNMEISFKGYSASGEERTTLGSFNAEQFNLTDGSKVYWNQFFFNYTHTYLDDLFGHIRVEVYWHNTEYTSIGYKLFWLYIAYASDEKPIISLIDPQNDGRWGANTTAYISIASWHLNTISSWAKIDGDEYELKQLTDALEDGDMIPEDLTTVPSYLRKFYWFTSVETSEIAENHDLEQTGSTEIEIEVGSVAKYGSVDVYSDNTTVSVTLISHPNFIFDPVQNIYLDEKPQIDYYCPDGIVGMDVYIEGGTGSILIAEVGGNENTQSTFLYKGYHTYLVPLRLTTPGTFNIRLVITDDVGNEFQAISNEFSVIDTDDRMWFTRILDETVEISILWFSYLSIGIIYLRKKKKVNVI